MSPASLPWPRATLALLRTETEGLWRVWLFVFVAAFANVLLLVALSRVVGGAGVTAQYALLYVTAFGLFLYAQRAAINEIVLIAEEIASGLRLRLVDRLLSTDLQRRMEAMRLHEGGHLGRSAAALCEDLPVAASAAQAAATAVIAMLFIGTLWPPALALSALAVLGGAWVVRLRARQAIVLRARARESESAASEALGALLETPAAPEARAAALSRAVAAIESEATHRIALGRRRFEPGAVAALTVMGAAPLAAFAPDHASEAVAARILIAFLFLASPLIQLADALPTLIRLERTAEDLGALGRALPRAQDGG